MNISTFKFLGLSKVPLTKARTIQSSTYLNDGVKYVGNSSKAIDGDKSPRYMDGSCSHTTDDDRDPWWAVDLGTTRLISQVEITNRGLDQCPPCQGIRCSRSVSQFSLRTFL